MSTLPVHGFGEEDWAALLEAIKQDECTPFLGAGICAGTLPTGETLARELAAAIKYPLSDWDNLARVSQFAIHTLRGSVNAKRKVLQILGIQPGQSGYRLPPVGEEEPHRVLSRLPLKLYITTNYDDYLFRALRDYRPKARREYCHWYGGSNGDRGQNPPWNELSKDSPLVFHLHGLNDVPDSLVVTEDDYLDFLMNIGRKLNKLVPPLVQGAITGSSLLFIGYGLRDWNFRVLLRALVSKVMKSHERFSFMVQLPPLAYGPGSIVSVHLNNGDRVTGKLTEQREEFLKLDTETIGSICIRRSDICHPHALRESQELLVLERMQDIMATYHKGQIDVDLSVYWGTAQQFAKELWTNWERASAAPGALGS